MLLHLTPVQRYHRDISKIYSVFTGMLILFSLTAAAQSSSGKLTGKISDLSTNEPLAGVSISVKGSQKGVLSITDGTYILSLAPGSYSLIYTYSGYKAKEITEIIIKAGEATFQNILLETASKQIAGVVVTATSAKKESQSSVYSAQKRSAAASDGISLEAIRKTPDNNAGQILKRVTGINVQDNRFVVVRGLGEQYNQTMLNGVPMTSTETNRNAFAFDLIPAAVIDNITVNKTATPDMPGNFAGGIVQINTKDFPANDFISVTIGTTLSDGTYNKDFYSDKRGKYEWLGFGGKTRDLPKDFPTSTSHVPFTSLNQQERFRYTRLLNNNLTPVNYGRSGLNENLQLGFGKTIKLKRETQFGIVAALNQRKTQLIEQETVAREPVFNRPDISDTTGIPNIRNLDYYSENIRYRYTVDFGGVLNLAYRFGNSKITLKNLYTRVFNNTYIDRPYVSIEGFGLQPGAYKQVGYSYLTEERRIFNSTLAGEHRTGKNNETRLDWNVNVTSNNTSTPDLRNFLFNSDSARTQLAGDFNADFEQSLVRFSRSWSSTNDFIYGGAFNITSPFDFLKNKQLLKGGILFQNRRREATGTVLPISNLAGTIDSIFDPSNIYPGRGEVVVSTAAFVAGAGNYNAGSSLIAAYESLENKIGKQLRIIWGLRLENYQQSVNVYNPTYLDNFQNPELIVTKFAARTTFNFLPSVNIIYSPATSLNLRAAYSNTVIRPELKDLAEFSRYDFQTFSLTFGNANLKSTAIQNIDFKLEWFPSSGEILSLAAFYKKIQDPIEYARPNTIDALRKFRIPVNAGDAYVKGIEMELRKKLSFIGDASWLSHVTVFGNAALIRSKVPAKQLNSFFFTSISEHALTGQPDYIVNSGLSILAFKNSFELTASFNRTGDYISELGTNDLLYNQFGNMVADIPPYHVKGRNMVDLVLTQAFLKERGKIKFNISNLLKTKYIVYQDLNGNGKYDDPVQVKKIPGVSLDTNYLNGTDNTASSILAQRHYALSLSYTF